MRVVLDTNIFMSAFFESYDENCSIILKKERNGEFLLLMSNEMTEELLRVTKSLAKRNELEDSQKEFIFTVLSRALRRTEAVEPKTKFDKCEDEDDNMFFSCAIDGNADYIISKDKHIQALRDTGIKNKKNKKIEILYPDEFVNNLKKIALVSNSNE